MINYMWKITMREDYGNKAATFNLIAPDPFLAVTKAVEYKNTYDDRKFLDYSVTAIERGESVQVV